MAPLTGNPRPRLSHRPAHVAGSSGPEAVALAARCGLVLDEWQAWILQHALAERPGDGKWAAFEVGLIIPRQNGKNAILEARELAGLFLFGESLIIHTAHQFKTARRAFMRIRQLIESVPEFDRRVAKVSASHGEEGITLIGGQELKYLARRDNMGDTLIQPATQRVPTFGLLGILADKAFALGKPDEAERLLTELLDQVLGDLEAGREVKSDLFDRSTEYAMKLAAASGSARWIEYIFRAFSSVRRPCPAGIVDELYSLVRRVDRVNLGALRTYIEVLRENTGTLGPTERFLVSRIEGLERLVAAK